MAEVNSIRKDKVTHLFEQKFKNKPEFYIRSPGRVNLLGEHVDYHGYAVLPMAIELDILLAVGKNPRTIHLVNTDNKYEEFSTKADDVQINSNAPKWHDYALCGYKGIDDVVQSESAGNKQQSHASEQPVAAAGSGDRVETPDRPPHAYGFNAAVDGTVPASAGLSSSSALVCGAAFAAMQLNKSRLNYPLGPERMAELCAVSERYVGVQGGGMDQAICFMAKAGEAKRIDFNPVRATGVKLPRDASFIIAHSCVEMNKAASNQFNIRVMEGRLAAKLLAVKHHKPLERIRTLRDIQDLLSASFDDMLVACDKHLRKNGTDSGVYTKAELVELLALSSEQIDADILSSNTREVAEFNLFGRAKHVYSEAKRVVDLEKICRDRTAAGEEEKLKQMAAFMNASHASCRDQYACSGFELDELVECFLNAGALAARLTGAGWGGCCVGLCRTGTEQEVLEKVRRDFYGKTQERLDCLAKKQALFITKPSAGAEMIYPY